MDFKFHFDVGEVGAEKSPSVNNERDLSGKQDDPEAKENGKACHALTVEDVLKHWSSRAASSFYEVDIVTLSGDVPPFVVVSPSNANEDEDSDLIPNVYEGGFKVWECTTDLINFIVEKCGEIHLKGKTVLDLGCGVGLLGIYALIQGGADRVTFQDFNESVIMESTGPSSLVNLFRRRYHDIHSQGVADELPGHSKAKRTKLSEKDGETDSLDLEIILKNANFSEFAAEKIDFLAGDWASLATTSACGRKLDVILSSETIYNVSHYQKLHNFLEASLSGDGEIFMSAKSYYFGVGGGVESWSDFVRSKNVFDIEIVRKIDAHLQRHILRMAFREV